MKWVPSFEMEERALTDCGTNCRSKRITFANAHEHHNSTMVTSPTSTSRVLIETGPTYVITSTLPSSSRVWFPERMDERGCFRRAINPMLVLMNVIGLYHKNDRWCSLSRVYAALILFIFAANFLRFFTTYNNEKFGNVLLFKLIVHSWYFQTLFGFAICFKAQVQGQFQRFLTAWDRFIYNGYSMHFTSYVRRATMICIVVSSFVIAADAAGMYYGLAFPSIIDKILLTPVDNDQLIPYLKYTYGLLYAYLTSSWVLSVSIIILICVCLTKQYNIMVHLLEDTSEPGKWKELFAHYRRQHNELSDIAAQANAMFHPYVMNILVTNVTMVCFLGFHLATYARGGSDQAILGSDLTIYWIVFCSLQMYCTIVSTSWLNQTATCMPEATINRQIHRTDVSFTPTEATQIQSFLTRLSNGRIGFSAGNIFFISRPALVTVSAVIISYIVMLLKLGQSFSQEAKPQPELHTAGSADLAKNLSLSITHGLASGLNSSHTDTAQAAV